MTTVTQTFDKQGNKKLETEMTKIMDKDTITKETTNSLSKLNSQIFHNDITDNQDNLIESEMLKCSPLKDTSTMVQLKDDSKYISSNDVDKLHDTFLKMVGIKTNYNNSSVNVVSFYKTLK